MTHKVNSPPPPPQDAVRGRRGEPWHKPILYHLTDYIDTAGSPANKDAISPPGYEDETLPTPKIFKQYRPATA